MPDTMPLAEVHEILKRNRLMGNLAVQLGVSHVAVLRVLNGSSGSKRIEQAARALATKCKAKEMAAA